MTKDDLGKGTTLNVAIGGIFACEDIPWERPGEDIVMYELSK